METMQSIPTKEHLSTEANSGSLIFEQTRSDEMISHVFSLMQPEFIPEGGNLRELSLERLTEIANRDGELWIAREGNRLLSCQTVTPLPGQFGNWSYLNYGVVAPEERHQGGQIIENLIKTCVNVPRETAGFVVITVARGIFARNGFSQIDVEGLNRIDPIIARIINEKIRPDKESYIFVLQKEGKLC